MKTYPSHVAVNVKKLNPCRWLSYAISNILFLYEKFQHEFIIFTCHPLFFCILSCYLSMGKSDLKQAATKHSQNFGDMFKRKKLSPMPTLNHVADPSTHAVDQSVDSSASTTPEVNIYARS